jgi:putative membrane protein
VMAFCVTLVSFGAATPVPFSPKTLLVLANITTPTRHNAVDDQDPLYKATVERGGQVPYGEISRQYRQTVFSHSNWVKHRSSDRFLSNLSSIVLSGIVRQLWSEIIVVAAVAFFVVLWNGYAASFLPTPFQRQLRLPSLPFTLSSSALGLLLVFRTNASYTRWLEAGKIWSTISAQSRNIVRMAFTFSARGGTDRHTGKNVNRNEIDERIERVLLATWLYSRSLMNKLAGPDDDTFYLEDLNARFTAQEHMFLKKRILAASDRPTAASMELSTAINNLPIDKKLYSELDKSIAILGQCVAKCERIFSTPIPLVYTRHTSRFLTFWMLLLPFALYEHFAATKVANLLPPGLRLIPAMIILAFFFCGIFELSIQLEEPFSILPMHKFCDAIWQESLQMKEWSATTRSLSLLRPSFKR